MESIDTVILGLIEQYGTRDVYELCDALGIEIRTVEPGNPLLRGHDSVYYRYLNDSEIIFISNELEYQIIKFVLAHELGHAILHTYELTATFNKSLVNGGKLERQANYFAFKLCNIHFDEVDLCQMTLEQIASCEGVPYEALKQLVNL